MLYQYIYGNYNFIFVIDIFVIDAYLYFCKMYDNIFIIGYSSEIQGAVVHFQQPMKMAYFRNDPTWDRAYHQCNGRQAFLINKYIT